MSSLPTASDRCECGAELPAITVHGYEVQMPRCWPCQTEWLKEEDAREREQRRAEVYERSGLTGRLLVYTLAGFREFAQTDSAKAALAVAESWLDAPSPRPNLILFGQVGLGKTSLAASIVRELCDRRVNAAEMNGNSVAPPALFVLWRDMLAEMRAAFGTRDRDPGMTFELAKRIPVLVLDDLGAERPTDWARDELATLVQARYDDGLPIIVTTNYQGESLAARLGHDDPTIGKRILSRLLEGATTRSFIGADQRRAA